MTGTAFLLYVEFMRIVILGNQKNHDRFTGVEILF